MRNEAIWAIRDARGLTTSEKAFLFVIESRGIAKTYRKTLMNDCGISDGQVTNLVRSLISKGCLAVKRDGRQTTYSVSLKGLTGLVPDYSHSEHSHSEDSHSEDSTTTQSVSPQPVSSTTQPVSTRTHSVSLEHSLSEDNKKKKKKNIEEELEEQRLGEPVEESKLESTFSNNEDSETLKGRNWLETLLSQESRVNKEEARTLFEDMSHRPDVPKSTRRAALAAMDATPDAAALARMAG